MVVVAFSKKFLRPPVGGVVLNAGWRMWADEDELNVTTAFRRVPTGGPDQTALAVLVDYSLLHCDVSHQCAEWIMAQMRDLLRLTLYAVTRCLGEHLLERRKLVRTTR